MYAQSIPNDPGATYAAKSPAETGPLLSSSQASSRIAPNAASTSSVVRLASAHSRASSSSSGMRSDPPPHVIRPTFPHVCLQQSNLTMASDSLFCCGNGPQYQIQHRVRSPLFHLGPIQTEIQSNWYSDGGRTIEHVNSLWKAGYPLSRTFFSAIGTSLSRSLRAILFIGSELSTILATAGAVK